MSEFENGVARAYRVAISEGKTHEGAIEYIVREKGLERALVLNLLATIPIAALTANTVPDFEPKNYVVICRDDRQSDGTQGEYIQATRRLFTAEEAAAYAQGIAPGREARIISPREFLLHVLGWREQ